MVSSDICGCILDELIDNKKLSYKPTVNSLTLLNDNSKEVGYVFMTGEMLFIIGSGYMYKCELSNPQLFAETSAFLDKLSQSNISKS